MGVWRRPGRRSSNATFPGSYYLYEKVRMRPKKYPKTTQQKKVAEIARECKRTRGSKKQWECVRDAWK